MPSFIIYNLGFQWAWTYSISYLHFNIGYTSYHDHYIMSSYFYNAPLQSSTNHAITLNNAVVNTAPCSTCTDNNTALLNALPINFTSTTGHYHAINLYSINNYLFEVNAYLVIPLWSCIKIYCFSLDVIHSLSFYSFGFKIDAIPGRINLTSSLRSLVKGVNRGFCYELCGEQHTTMLNTWILF